MPGRPEPRRPHRLPTPPSWCYPPSTDFACDKCGAEPDEACDPARLYGPTISTTSGTVHLARAQARGREVLHRVSLWRTQEGIEE